MMIALRLPVDSAEKFLGLKVTAAKDHPDVRECDICQASEPCEVRRSLLCKCPTRWGENPSTLGWHDGGRALRIKHLDELRTYDSLASALQSVTLNEPEVIDIAQLKLKGGLRTTKNVVASTQQEGR